MNTQNIKYFDYNKLKIKLDSSSYFDLTLRNDEIDLYFLNLSTGMSINDVDLIFNSNCLSGITLPLEFKINEQIITNTCNFKFENRYNEGWSFNIVFDKTNHNWSDGKVFFYSGIKNELDEVNFVDNNLSFSFTTDGRIIWKSIHYSGGCVNNTFTKIPILFSGQTNPLNVENIFDITITFKRNYTLYGCDLLNYGGVNDLISGYTITNINNVLTGATIDVDYVQTITNNWILERNNRLGQLKIYVNGKLFYLKTNWEEIIPTKRTSNNDIYNIFGGGTNNSGNIHSGNTLFNILRIKYWSTYLNYIDIYKQFYNNNLLYLSNNNTLNCINEITGFFDNQILLGDYSSLQTNDNNLITY